MTPVYERVTGHEYHPDPVINIERRAMMIRHWSGTPWMTSARIGRGDEGVIRAQEIREWLIGRYGPEADPYRGEPGDWLSGSAIVDGWTWYGFATREQMDEFRELVPWKE